MTAFLSWEKSWVCVARSSSSECGASPFCRFGWSRTSRVLLDPTEREAGRVIYLFLNTMFTNSLFALSSLFTWISKANYFIRNVFRKQDLFLTPGHPSKSKGKRAGKEGCFLWGQHLHIWLSPQWEFTTAFQHQVWISPRKGPTYISTTCFWTLAY